MAHFTRRRNKKSFTLGTPKSVSLLLWIAQQKGFLADHKVKVDATIVPYSRKAMEMMLDDQIDSFMAMETNIAYLGYLKPKTPVKCLFSIEKRTADCLIAAEKNIGAGDLKGKVIGFTPRTTSHTFLIQFLKKYGLEKQAVRLKALSPEALPDALMRKEIYAACMWQPRTNNTMIAMQELGLDYTFFPNTGFHSSHVVFTTKKTNTIKHSEFIKNFIAALKDAETYLKEDKERAYKMLAESMQIRGENYREIIDCFSASITPIGDEYLQNVKTLGHWIRENDTEFLNKELPNYSEFIEKGLFLDRFTENK